MSVKSKPYKIGDMLNGKLIVGTWFQESTKFTNSSCFLLLKFLDPSEKNLNVDGRNGFVLSEYAIEKWNDLESVTYYVDWNLVRYHDNVIWTPVSMDLFPLIQIEIIIKAINDELNE